MGELTVCVNFKRTTNDCYEWFGLLFASTAIIGWMLGISSSLIEFRARVVWLGLSPVLWHNLAVENNSCLTSTLEAFSDLGKVIHAAFSLLLFSNFFLNYLMVFLMMSCYLIPIFDAESTSRTFARKIFQRFSISGVSWFHIWGNRFFFSWLSLYVMNMLWFFSHFLAYRKWRRRIQLLRHRQEL